MAEDIFGFNAKYKGVGLVTAKDMILTIENSTGGVEGEYLVQNVAINYQQPIQIIRELSSGNPYYQSMPPQGTVSFGRIVGKRPITALLGATGQGVWTAPGPSEDAGSRTVMLVDQTGVGPKYKMYGCIVEGFTTTADANSSLVQENVSMRFGMLSIEG